MLYLDHVAVGYVSGKIKRIISSEISASAMPGELVALLGLNGIGKSTLLRTIAALQPPMEGRILLNDRSLQSYSRSRLALQISFVSSSHIHVPDITVRELAALGRHPYTNWIGKLGKEDVEKVDESLTCVRMYQMAGQHIYQISDGERQRAQIARALAQDTDLILLDEPTAFLDVVNKYDITVLLRKLCREKMKTVVFSTHDWNVALQTADRVWLMENGRFTEGAPEDLIANGTIRRMFAGSEYSVDPETGMVQVPVSETGKVKLSGSASVDFWLQKALRRKGFVSDDSAAVSIDTAFRGGWVVAWPGGEKICNTLLDLTVTLQDALQNTGTSTSL